MPDFNQDSYWWVENDDKLFSAVFEYVKHLDRSQSHKEAQNIRHMKLYGNFNALGIDAFSYSVDSNSTSQTTGRSNRLTLNVIQSICDTVGSKISKNKPKPEFLTNGGDWFEQQKGKKLNQFCEGIFHNVGIYEKASQIFLDSTIFGTGVMKIFREGNEVQVERVFPNEIKVDDIEAVHGEPRQMHQTKFIHRDVLRAMFPDNAKEIGEVKGGRSRLSPASAITDMIQVIESWHLPSGKVEDEKGQALEHDGLRAITINNATLLSEPYVKSFFPFVFMRWGLRPLGFFGQGIAEQVQGLQLEINKILKTIQISMHLTSIPKVFIEAGSKVVSSHMNNEIGGIIKYAGKMPEWKSVGAIPPELFSQLDRLYQRAFEQAGVSQLSAISLKPAGLDSGKALREFNDIETERFMTVGQRYENFFLEACEQMIDIVRDVHKESRGFSVKVKGKKFLKTINWKDIDLDDSKYIMQTFPVSSLSSTPAGRLEDVKELMQIGFVNREQGIKLLDYPDVNAISSLQTAAYDNIEKTMADMLEHGKYAPPEPFQNLALGLQLMQESYLHAKDQGAPDARLELLRRWMNDANALLQKVNVQAIADAQSAELQSQTDVAAAGQTAEQEQTQAEEIINSGEPLPEIDPETLQ